MMTEKSSRFFNLAAVAVCGAYWVFFSYIMTRYAQVFYGGWDLSLYGQAMWSVCHGVLKPSLYETTFLADHANYIAFLLAPFYYFFQDVSTLMQIKVFSFCGAALILYHCAKLKLGPAMAFGFMLLYIIFPANVFMLFFPFNFENLALPFIFLMYYCFEKGYWKRFLLFGLLLCSVKENMPSILAMFGVLGLLCKKGDRLRWGVVPLLMGVLIFYIVMFVLTPYMRQDSLHVQSNYWNLFNKEGLKEAAVPLDVIQKLILHPVDTWNLLFMPKKLIFLNKLFGGLAPAVALSPHIFMLGVPILTVNLLSHFHGQQMIELYYHATVAAFIFLSLINSVAYARGWLRRIFFIVIAMTIVVHASSFSKHWMARLHIKLDFSSVMRWQMIEQIPKGADVLTSYSFAPVLSQRAQVYILGRYDNYFTNRKCQIPYDKLRWAIVDLADPWLSPQLLKEQIFNSQWKLWRIVDELALFRKDIPEGITGLMTPNPKDMPQGCSFDMTSKKNDLTLDCVYFNKWQANDKMLRMVFYWRALDDIRDIYQVRVVVRKAGETASKVVRLREIGYHVSPTKSWKKGDRLKEVFYYSLPEGLSQGKYKINVQLINKKTNHWSILYPLKEDINF